MAKIDVVGVLYYAEVGWYQATPKREDITFDVDFNKYEGGAKLTFDGYEEKPILTLGTNRAGAWAFKATERVTDYDYVVVFYIGGAAFCVKALNFPSIFAVMKEIDFHSMVRNSLLVNQDETLSSCLTRLYNIEDALHEH